MRSWADSWIRGCKTSPTAPVFATPPQNSAASRLGYHGSTTQNLIATQNHTFCLDKRKTGWELCILQILPIGEASCMCRHSVVLPLMLCMLIAVPAQAYVDPSGGALFQVLMPILVGIWATWLIFANRVRCTISRLIQKFSRFKA